MDGPTNGAGRVEVYDSIKGQWGTICDDQWSFEDAYVACKQLGFKGAKAAKRGGVYPQGTGEIMLTNVACEGTESMLVDCQGDVHEASCSHSEDAGVECFTEDESKHYTLQTVTKK